MRRVLLLLLCLTGLAASAQQTTTSATNAATTTAVDTTSTDVAQANSRETRDELREILRRTPPEVGKALKLDPMLWSNEQYLTAYPELAAFVARHPEVKHTPSYFLEDIWIPGDATPETPNTRMWREVMDIVSGVLVASFIIGTLTWLIRTTLEQRRWSRVAKTQSEVHNKLLDRFTANDELLAYINTTAGKRFLESAPLSIEASPRSIGAPIARVLWSVQAGLVLIAGGLGLRYVGSTAKDVAEPLSAMGVLAIAIGAGLLVAAVASYALSRKLGLLPPAADSADAAAE